SLVAAAREVKPRDGNPHATASGMRGPSDRSERAQEGDQVGLLLVAELELEARVVEVDDVVQGRGRAVVEVRGAPRQAAEDRALHAPDVLPLAGDERPPGIRHDLLRLAEPAAVRPDLAQRVD